MKKIQKRIRLKDFDYRGCYRYYLTINTNYKRKFFINDIIFREVKKILREVSKEYCFTVWVYTFMPTHLHTLVEGQKENADFRKFVAIFKQKISYYFKKKTGEKLWQENYYEHVLRSDEDTMKVVKYILNNPVRAGLVKHYYDYPYSGSFIIKDLSNLF